MFTGKKVVLTISKQKIKAEIVALGKKNEKTLIAQSNYSTQSFTELLIKIKKQFGTSIRILLEDELVYLANIAIPKDASEKRTLLQEKAQEVIPENLTFTLWEFKEIPVISQIGEEKDTKTFQIISFVQPFLKELATILITNQMKTEAIEPLSYALARYTHNIHDATLIAYMGQNPLLVLAQKGFVISSEQLKEPATSILIKQFLTSSEQFFKISPKKYILSGESQKTSAEEYGKEQLPLAFQNLDPAISLALKTPLKKHDEEALNRELFRMKDVTIQTTAQSDTKSLAQDVKEEYESQNAPPKKKNSRRVILLLTFVLIPILLLALFFFFGKQYLSDTNKNQKPTATKQNLLPTPTSLPTSPSPVASESAKINIADYRVSILNGSGQPGEAGKLSAILKSNGFTVIATDNADRNDYELSEIRYKDSVPDEAKKTIDKELKTLYSTIVGRNLESTSSADIVIIIGQK